MEGLAGVIGSIGFAAFAVGVFMQEALAVIMGTAMVFIACYVHDTSGDDR